ncbi:Insertion sequence IS5376 putative ATP-binding protein [Lactococcus lactis]|nr:Insertion sequence IS5376 putative ATP-binding protein [Lactococcus lactis]
MTTYHQLLNQLDHLKLDRVRQLLPEFLDEHADISLVEGLHELLSEELREREALLQERRYKKAHLPYEKRVMDFDFQFQPKINKAEILDLHTLRFLDKHENLLFIGNSGVGKTHLAISITLEALEKGYSSYFCMSTELVDRLLRANQKGTLERVLKQYANYDVLVIDEVGYLPFSRDGASLLFQLINMRYEKKSTLITTNIPLSQWSEFLQDKKLTNALLDRLVHHSKVISITGKSYRMKDYSEKKTKTPKSK